MERLTHSFTMFLMKFHRDLYVPITFGHLEHLTDELVEEYRAWLQTDEGKQYLPGGSKYKEEKE